MSRKKKVLLGLLGVLLLYPLVLIVLSYALVGVVEERVRDRLAYMLRADNVTIEKVDLSLLRGRVTIRGIHAERSGLGTASLEIGQLDLELAKMGLVILDSSPTSVVIREAHLDLSALGAATLRRSTGRPLHVERLEIFDSSVRLVATSLFPGIGKAELFVEQARASDLTLHNAMAWLYRSDLLLARLKTTGDVELSVRYQVGRIEMSGSFLGSTPISVPFVWPDIDPSELELRQLLRVGKALTSALAPELAKRKAAALWDQLRE